MIARSVHQFSVWCILCLDNLPTWNFVFSIRYSRQILYLALCCSEGQSKRNGYCLGQDKVMMTARFFCLISLQTRNTARKDSRLFSFRIITEISFLKVTIMLSVKLKNNIPTRQVESSIRQSLITRSNRMILLWILAT